MSLSEVLEVENLQDQSIKMLQHHIGSGKSILQQGWQHP